MTHINTYNTSSTQKYNATLLLTKRIAEFWEEASVGGDFVLDCTMSLWNLRWYMAFCVDTVEQVNSKVLPSVEVRGQRCLATWLPKDPPFSPCTDASYARNSHRDSPR
eukprot:1414579-Amphidinium_carterae.2